MYVGGVCSKQTPLIFYGYSRKKYFPHIPKTESNLFVSVKIDNRILKATNYLYLCQIVIPSKRKRQLFPLRA